MNRRLRRNRFRGRGALWSHLQLGPAVYGSRGCPQNGVAFFTGEAIWPVDVVVVALAMTTWGAATNAARSALPAFAVTATPNVVIATTAPLPTTAATNLTRRGPSVFSRSIVMSQHRGAALRNRGAVLRNRGGRRGTLTGRRVRTVGGPGEKSAHTTAAYSASAPLSSRRCIPRCPRSRQPNRDDSGAEAL